LGQKVHPVGFRLGVIKGWQSRWYADQRTYRSVLSEDFAIRNLINKELANAAVARIEIERMAGTQITVNIYTAKPGIVIGRSGEKVERLRVTLEKLTKKKVHPKILEIRTPELEAVLVARSIAEQLEKRVSFRRAMKQAVQKAMKAGAKGIKVICGGRLGGAEIARSEREVEGSVPLHTLRADIDFAIAEAHTTFGIIGVKVWIYKGLVLPGRHRQPTAPIEADMSPRPERSDRGERRGDRRGGGERRGDRRGGGRFEGRGGGRGDRPMGDRPPRPMGERSPRPVGDRGPRPAPAPTQAAAPTQPEPPAPASPPAAPQQDSTPAPAPESQPES
jgi:small subunit ribosomal protein S3